MADDKLVPVEGDKLVDPQQVIHDIKRLQAINVVAVVEIGARLKWLHDYYNQTRWETILRYDLGIGKMTAYRYMGVAERLKDNIAMKQLEHLPVTKVYALMEATDAEIDELVQGGGLGDKPMDEIYRMTTTELRDHIHSLRVVQEKLEAKIEKGVEQVEKLKDTVQDKSARIRELESGRNAADIEVEKECTRLRAQIDAIIVAIETIHDLEEHPKHTAAILSTLNYGIERYNTLSQQIGIRIDGSGNLGAGDLQVGTDVDDLIKQGVLEEI